MSLPKLFFLFTASLLGLIVLIGFFKKSSQDNIAIKTDKPVQIALEDEIRSVKGSNQMENAEIITTQNYTPILVEDNKELPDADLIDQLFRVVEPKLPIVKTITYTSKVDWLKGRPAWIADYASHFKTSRHFIARSLNRKPDYNKQNVSIGDRFNVLNDDIDLSFYLVIDLSRSKMWFYYYDQTSDTRKLIKTYDVGLGRVDSSQSSGLLTPLGTYSLGEKVGIYYPKKKGEFKGNKIEMVRIFGTRWIPFQEEIEGCTAPAKGLGIHGLPWEEDHYGKLIENRDCIGKYESDGCIRLKQEDMEEIFAIIITKPSYVVLVKDFFNAKLPGKEKKSTI